jgi:hypothetical protein
MKSSMVLEPLLFLTPPELLPSDKDSNVKMLSLYCSTSTEIDVMSGISSISVSSSAKASSGCFFTRDPFLRLAAPVLVQQDEQNLGFE